MAFRVVGGVPAFFAMVGSGEAACCFLAGGALDLVAPLAEVLAAAPTTVPGSCMWHRKWPSFSSKVLAQRVVEPPLPSVRGTEGVADRPAGVVVHKGS